MWRSELCDIYYPVEEERAASTVESPPSVDDEALLQAALLFMGDGSSDETEDSVDDEPDRLSFEELAAWCDASDGLSSEPESPRNAERVFLNRRQSTGSKPCTTKRRQREIRQLQIQSQVLKKQLRELQQEKEWRDAVRNGESSSEMRRDYWVSEVLGNEWMRIAKRQLQQRQEAEAQQNSLRAAIEEQKRTLRALKRVLKSYTEKREKLRLLDVVPSLHCTLSDRASKTGVYDALTASVASMLTQTDVVIADPRLDTLTGSEFFLTSAKTLGKYPLAVQTVDARLVPYDLESTAEAVWGHLVARSVGAQCERTEELPDQTVRTQFDVHVAREDIKISANGTSVLRRVFSQDRIVMVRSAIFAPAKADPSTMRTVVQRFPVRHYLWMAVERPRHPDLRSRQECSQVHICSVTVPSQVPQDEVAVEKLTNFYVSISKYYSARAREDVDSFLLSRGSSKGWEPHLVLPTST